MGGLRRKKGGKAKKGMGVSGCVATGEKKQGSTGKYGEKPKPSRNNTYSPEAKSLT